MIEMETWWVKLLILAAILHPVIGIALPAQERDASGELLLRREKRGLIPFLNTLQGLAEIGNSVAEAVTAVKNNQYVLHCELTNFSKWQVRNPTATLNSSELLVPEGPVILPGKTEAFVATPQHFWSRNEGKMSWTVQDDSQSSIRIEWSIHMHAGILSSWFGLGGHTNKLTVCISKSCDYQENNADSRSNCVCLGDLCVLGTMGTKDQAYAKISILPKSRFDLAKGMLESDDTSNYSYQSCSP